MKGSKLTILVLSLLLLTISSGLLFYKNLFLLDHPGAGGKVDFEELRFIDLEAAATLANMRKNLSNDTTVISSQVTRMKELLNIITDVNKGTPELKNSVEKLQNYFGNKVKAMETFSTAIKELRFAVDTLNPNYYELNKNNLKFSVDNKKDFYRECVLDAFAFVALSSKENEQRLTEDKKILGQVVNFASTPNPVILKFSNNIENLMRRTKEIDRIIESFNKDNSIAEEMSTVGKYYNEAQDSKSKDGEIFLSMVFAAIVLYLGCVVYVLKKLS